MKEIIKHNDEVSLLNDNSQHNIYDVYAVEKCLQYFGIHYDIVAKDYTDRRAYQFQLYDDKFKICKILELGPNPHIPDNGLPKVPVDTEYVTMRELIGSISKLVVYVFKSALDVKATTKKLYELIKSIRKERLMRCKEFIALA